jgi:hypothetical protein
VGSGPPGGRSAEMARRGSGREVGESTLATPVEFSVSIFLQFAPRVLLNFSSSACLFLLLSDGSSGRAL